MENQGIASPSLFRGPPAYEPRTPWQPLVALVAGVVIVGASAVIVGAVLLLGAGAESSTSGIEGSPWRQDEKLAAVGAWLALAGKPSQPKISTLGI